MMSQVNSLADVNIPFEAFKDSLGALAEGLKLVAHVVIPPPGGQIIAAAIAIGGMLVAGAMNVKQCCEMATWCNKVLDGHSLFHYVYCCLQRRCI